MTQGHACGDDVATEMNLSHPKVPKTADGRMSVHVGCTHTHPHTHTHKDINACARSNVFNSLNTNFN